MVKKNESGFIWIPRPYQPTWKIIIGTTDVTDDLLVGGLEFNKPVTYKIGKFSLKLDNSGGTYNDYPTGAEDVYIYLDNEQTSATTLQFRGRIELPKYSGATHNVLEIIGTHYAGSLLDLNITKTYTTATACDTILKTIIDEFTTGFTHTHVESCSITFDPNWNENPFWECIIDLCEVADYDCYVDDFGDFHFFKRSSKITELDAIVWKDNLLDRGGIGDSGEDVKNKISVYGENENGLPIVYVASDNTASDYPVKERVIKAFSIKTYAEAKSRGDAELALLKTPIFKGSPKTLLLTNMDGAGTIGHGGPGYLIWISDPTIKLQGTYRVTDLRYKYENNAIFTTTIDLENPASLPRYFRERLSREIASETIINPGMMEYTYAITFDSDNDILSHTQTETFGGKLRCAIDMGVGKRYTSGTTITNKVTTTSDITVCDLRVSGQDIGATQFFVSNTDGISYEEIAVSELGTSHTFSNSNKQLKLKIILNSTTDYPTPEIDSIVCLYK